MKEQEIIKPNLANQTLVCLASSLPDREPSRSIDDPFSLVKHDRDLGERMTEIHSTS